MTSVSRCDAMRRFYIYIKYINIFNIYNIYIYYPGPLPNFFDLNLSGGTNQTNPNLKIFCKTADLKIFCKTADLDSAQSRYSTTVLRVGWTHT